MENLLKYQANLNNSAHIIEDEDKSKYAGLHFFLDLWGGNITEDPKELEKILKQAAKEANSEPKKVAIHKFSPHGITGVLVLAESHISIHTWPELDYAAIDIFTCGKKAKPEKALEYLKKVFNPKKVEITETKRGKISQKEKDKKIFGLELTLDLFNCEPQTIRSKEKILEYSEKLCNLIKMKRYGKPFIEKFAEGSKYAAGYSLAQMIETSLVSGHFCEAWNSAYINVFSCKSFNAKKAEDFTKNFFGAKRLKSQINIR
ncbi:adenosylmethionine decarboxylase [Candidatus Babeliales bacterium]|nr:adenosylmethionine decarboxylase [Candidatus Babeliales bacterium]